MSKCTKIKQMQKKLLILLTTMLSLGVYAQESNNSAVVLELFTSQGCSSCPPADALLNYIKETQKDQNVYVLSYHVDYWNRLGWKDPFSTETFTDYQRDYAQKFNSRSVYTPQLVVNGSEHFTGSNKYKADAALKIYSTTKANNSIVIEDVKKAGDKISLSYQIKGADFTTLTFALTVSERITYIKRGENGNRTLKNSNIVANRILAHDSIGQVDIPLPGWINPSDQLSIIAYTQDRNLQTTGATKVEL